MSFDEVSFPEKIAYGTRGGPKYSTTIHETAGGREERTSRWAYSRREWDASYGVNSHDDLAEVLTFFHARSGSKRGFRFKDPFDNSTSSKPWTGGDAAVAEDDVQIGVGDGSTTTFQLIKLYTSGAVTQTRPITKPIAGTVVMAVNGSTVTDGVDFTVNTTTGVVTFGSAPTSSHAITAGFSFEVPTRFANDSLDTNFDTYSSGSASIALIEVLENTSVSDLFLWGGHLDLSLAVDRALAVTEARSYSVDATTSGLSLTLPSPVALPAGGPYFVVHNVGSTNAVNLKDSGGTTLLSVGTGTSVTVALYVEADGTSKGWIAW